MEFMNYMLTASRIEQFQYNKLTQFW